MRLPNIFPLSSGVFGEALSSTFLGFVQHTFFDVTIVGSSGAWRRWSRSLSSDARACAAGFGGFRVTGARVGNRVPRTDHKVNCETLIALLVRCDDRKAVA